MTVRSGLRKNIVAMAIIVHLVGAAGADEAPLRVGGNVTRPEKISEPPPVYTELARNYPGDHRHGGQRGRRLRREGNADGA